LLALQGFVPCVQILKTHWHFVPVGFFMCDRPAQDLLGTAKNLGKTALAWCLVLGLGQYMSVTVWCPTRGGSLQPICVLTEVQR
jgi:hypothetical protein